jgi:glutamyl-tRNA reductase
MNFILVGLNHKSAGVEVREKFYFTVKELSDAYAQLKQYPSVKGSLILSTCNRVEVYASVDKIEKGFSELIEFICKYQNISQSDLLPVIYKKENQYAVSHLFKVTASLDSMVVGEYQIQGQVRDAYFNAVEHNAANNVINKLFQTAIRIGKKVRTETQIGKGSVSVATLATELIKQLFSHMHSFNVLLIGAGKISTLTAKNLQDFKSCKISVANRSKEHAQEFAQSFNGEVIDYDERYNAIPDNDIIIVSTSSKEYVINKEELMLSTHKHKNKVKVFIDLSIPRNIDPEINVLENINLYSIDDINNLINSNLSKRSLEVKKAEKIIDDLTEEYYDWYSKQFILPEMMEIKKELEVLRNRTIGSYKQAFNSLDREQQIMIEEMLDSYSDKLIKVIMKNIRNSASNEELIHITKTLRNTFTIDVND